MIEPMSEERLHDIENAIAKDITVKEMTDEIRRLRAESSSLEAKVNRLSFERDIDREAMREALDRLGLMSDSRSHELCDQLRERLEAGE